jgi:hypothetical protein
MLRSEAGLCRSIQAGKHHEENRSTGILGTDQDNCARFSALEPLGPSSFYGGLRNGLVLAGSGVN